MKRLPLAAAVVLLFTAPLWAATKTAMLQVPGMTCPVCPITVKKALQKVSGVGKVDVDYPKKQLLVTYDDARTSEAALQKATADAGYPSQVVVPSNHP